MMKLELIKAFTFIGYGACFLAGVWIMTWVIASLSAANKLAWKINELDKMFRDAVQSDWETRKYLADVRKQYPIKEKK